MKRVFLARLFCFSFLALAGLTSVAGAENRTDLFTVSPMLGAQLFKSSEGFKDTGFIGLNLGYNFTKNWSAELVGTYAKVDYSAPATGDFSYWTGRVDALYHFYPAGKFVPYVAAGLGLTSMSIENSDASDEDLLLNYGVGFKYFTSDRLALRFDARQAWRHEMTYDPTSHGKNYSNFLISGGLTFSIGGDHTAKRIESVDSDNDGVLDSLDSCSGTPSGAAVDAKGCALDSDGDGVLNTVDQCPGSLIGAQVDSLGCDVVVAAVVAAVVIEDADLDGVADVDDKCPSTPLVVPVNARGCPADTDLDGVFDVDDNCPDSVVGTSVDSTGCEIVSLPIEALTLEVVFASNSSKIDTKFTAEMQKAADFVKAHPGQTLIVAGYTDNIGSASANRKLSQKRADTVRWLLVSDYGVNKDRLTAKGFGEESPIADNGTQEGRRANRRVVIRTVD